jgi:hypothetical protein
VLAKVPGEIHVTGDDCCAKYLLLSNSHDGRGSVCVKFTPIRVVCQNTLVLALESGEKAYKVRHSRSMQRRLSDVQELIGLIWKTFQIAEELFQRLAQVRMDASRLDTYLEAVYPRTEKQRKEKSRPERWNRVIELFEVGDAPRLHPNHTLWGAGQCYPLQIVHRSHSSELVPCRPQFIGGCERMKLEVCTLAKPFLVEVLLKSYVLVRNCNVANLLSLSIDVVLVYSGAVASDSQFIRAVPVDR